MKFKPGDYEAIHRSPIWREKADFVFAAHIGTNGDKNEWEQLWGKKTGRNTFMLCCIPFFVYDIALGDEVEVDADLVAQRVTKSGGQTTFRVWFVEQDLDRRKGIVRDISKVTSLLEWSSENLLAVSVPSAAEAQMLANFLEECELNRFLQYETGKTLPYSGGVPDQPI